ncbi:MAG: hypothetical protein EAZ75_08965 [Flavobacteriia bacterium]|nr:MAG: hypothetical protein EAZ75_08965 [Flavobacteriia bacterium]
MAHEYHCTNCGKLGYGSAGSGPMSGSNPPDGWKTKWGSTKMFCSNRCKDEFNNRNSGNNTTQSNSSEPEKKSGGFLGGLMGGGDPSEKVAQIGLLGNLLADTMGENKEIRNKGEYVSKMVFSTNPDELANQMNELLTIGAGTENKHKELIKACYEKMDFGVMKLKSLGANAEADFFAEKRKSIKPKGMFGF